MEKFSSARSETIQAKYREVVLTDEEKEVALLEAKEKKYWQLKEEADARAKHERYQRMTTPWNYDQLFSYAQRQANRLSAAGGHKAYIFDEHTTPVFELLCMYFSGDPRFEQKGYSLSKGLLLQGNVGIGKTDIIRAFEKNRRQCFLTITANEICEKVIAHGIDYWRSYSGYVPGHGGIEEYFYQPQIAWMFDDIGTEESVNVFGTKIDPFPVILSERYKLKEKVPFNSLHLTTNLNGDDIEKRYDYRTRSRIREMFNVIKMTGTDRRK